MDIKERTASYDPPKGDIEIDSYGNKKYIRKE
jgi:hypothetical protein